MTVSQGHEAQPAARGFKYGKLVLALLTLALLSMIGLRVREALATRAAVGKERAAVGEKAKAVAAGPRQVELVRGTAAVVKPRVLLEGSLAPHDEVERAAADELGRVNAELVEHQEARRALAATVDAELLELYEDLRRQKKGIGAVALVDGVCQGCHEQLSAVERDRLKRAEGPKRCEHCRRILII